MPQGYPAGENGTARDSSIQCISYLKSLPALFKIAQVLFSLFAFICMQNQVATGCGGCLEWFQTAAMSGVLLSLMFFFVYLFNIVKKFAEVPWRGIDLTCCIIWMIFNLSVTIKMSHVLVTFGCIVPGQCGYSLKISAIFFGFLAMIAYGFDAGLRLVRFMKGYFRR